MTFRTLILLAAISLTFFACNEDPVIDFDFDPAVMHFDGPNSSAPQFPAGTVEAAARFSAGVLDFYPAKQIDAVELYIYDVPASCRLIISGRGSGNRPGPELFNAPIGQQLTANAWNTLVLSEAIDIPTDELWIGIRAELDVPTQMMGCDSGPARNGGDWLYEGGDNQWLTFRGRGGDSVNWNIRARIK